MVSHQKRCELKMNGYNSNGSANAQESATVSKPIMDNGGMEGKSTRKRQTWSSQFDFIMTAVGCAVGLGNVWRFPYLCYKNGGGAFLIPYLISFFFVAAPTYLLETSIGQYQSAGCLQAFGLVPALKGIGFAAYVVIGWTNLYYVVVVAWALYYVYASFTTDLPWATCNNPWNSNSCFVTGMELNCTGTSDNETCRNMMSPVDSVVEFWENQVLHISGGIEEMGGLVPGLAVALLVAWVLVFFCIFGGVKWTGKIVYFTAVFPYVLLTVLLVRGVTLNGALDGLTFYLRPDFTRLSDPKVWIDGATQVLYSIGAGQGFMISIGSYNKFHSKIVRNSMIIISVNCLTSLYGGLAVFSILGFMAYEMNMPISEVVQSGPGLVFQAYPKAVTQMSASPFWSAMFFIMILFVGLDSQFVAVEGFLTPIMDAFPKTLYKPRNRTIFVAAYCCICFLIGLSMVTEGGAYLFRVVDYYSVSGPVLLFICLFELIAIGWVFGGQRYLDVLEMMTGRRSSVWFVLCWKYFAPVIIVGIFLFEMVRFKALRFNMTYEYPTWATMLGMLFSLSSTMCIPAVLIYGLYRTKGTIKEKWRTLTTPVLKKHQISQAWVGRDEYRWEVASYTEQDDVNEMLEKDDSIELSDDI